MSAILIFLLHSNEIQSSFIGWVEILMITLISSPKQHLPKDMQHSVSMQNVPGLNPAKETGAFI